MEIAESAENPLSNLRVAIIHYWFVGRAGGERVVEAIAEIFPQADLFSLVADRKTLAPILQARKLCTSFLQHVPGATRFHRHFLLLQPIALEQFDLSDYDLVISSESGPAKGVITSSRTCHICYCHSPMRYIWEMYPQYKRKMNPLVKTVFALVAHYMRLWDLASASRVDYFVANSNFIAGRIRKYYRRESTVIYPPVDVHLGTLNAPAEDFYLAIGRLVDYKRFDLAVEACTRMNRKLKVIGHGPEFKSLQKMAGPTIEFLGQVSDPELKKHLATCRALIFPGEEDFGMVPVEAQSFGRPVIAFGAGGVLETVRGMQGGIPSPAVLTGVFFNRQTTSDLVTAIADFEARESEFSPEASQESALRFSQDHFKAAFAKFASSVWTDFEDKRRLCS